MPAPPDEEARWAEAQSLLDRMPTESAEQRLRRWRVLRLLLVVGLALVGAVVGLVVVLLLDGGVRGADVPSWRSITGLVLGGLGLVLAGTGLVVQLRGNRRLGVWRNPLAPLTRRQRKELVAAVRDGRPFAPERLPLARCTAELLVHQRTALTGQVGFVLLFAGRWIGSPAAWRLGVAGVAAVGVLVGAVFIRRDVAGARRFLDAPPVPDNA